MVCSMIHLGVPFDNAFVETFLVPKKSRKAQLMLLKMQYQLHLVMVMLKATIIV